MAKAAGESKLGPADVIAGAVIFVGLVFLMQALLDSAVPGLLKTETMYHILASGLMFLIVWGLLGNYLFKPFLDVMEQREQRTQGDEALAAEKRREAARVQEKIDEELRLARLEGIRSRDARVEEARRKAQDIIAAAQARADAELSEAQAHVQRLKERAQADVPSEARQLADLVIGRALAVNPGQTVH